MYQILAMDLYWTGLIALLAVFVVSIVGMQMVVNIKCEHYDNQLNVNPKNPGDATI
jgi:phosphatidylserine synthase